MGAHLTTRGDHTLNVRVLRFRGRTEVEEPAMLALDLCATGRAKDAIDVGMAALQKTPDDADVLLALGRAYHEDGQSERAQAALIAAARKDRDWAEPYAWLSRVLAASGRSDKAAELASRAIALGATDEDLRARTKTSALDVRLARWKADRKTEDATLLAMSLLDAGRSHEARDVIEPELADDPDDEDLRVLAVRAGVAVPLTRRSEPPAPMAEALPPAAPLAEAHPAAALPAVRVVQVANAPRAMAKPISAKPVLAKPVLAKPVEETTLVDAEAPLAALVHAKSAQTRAVPPLKRSAAPLARRATDTVVDAAAPRRTLAPAPARPVRQSRHELMQQYLAARVASRPARRHDDTIVTTR